MCRAHLLLTSLLLLVLPPGIGSQEREIEDAGLPRTTADRLIAIASDPATHHLPGDSRIEADSVIPGDVVVMGPLYLAGRIEGELIVIHGDLEMAEGARVTGDLTVIHGDVIGSDAVTIGGTLIAYRRSSRLVQRGDRRREVATAPEPLTRDVRATSSFRFSLHGEDYNRVEGLPVTMGPILDTGGRNPFRARAHLIWRSQGQAPLATDRLGYRVSGEQFVGGQRAFRVGGGIHSTVTPVESWGLSDRENAWSTFLLHADDRDHFERRGWWVMARATPRSQPLELTVEYRDEEHGSLGAGDPWTLFRRDRTWRAQPLVAEGSLRSAVVTAQVDTRDDPSDPMDGWLVRTSWQQGLGGSLALPTGEVAANDQEAPGIQAPTLDVRFSSAFADVRRYQPIGRRGTLALRGVLAGSPDGDLLPPQFQHALGGVGSLPGYPSFAGDCGARTTQLRVSRDGDEAIMYPFYGCDRMALAQVEYRGPLHFDAGWGLPGETKRRRHDSHGGASWAVFFNAGRGWAAGDWGQVQRPQPTTMYDAGLGLLLGRGGIYWAVPMGEGMRGSTLTLRMNRRF
jgi:hypothetical protein